MEVGRNVSHSLGKLAQQGFSKIRNLSEEAKIGKDAGSVSEKEHKSTKSKLSFLSIVILFFITLICIVILIAVVTHPSSYIPYVSASALLYLIQTFMISKLSDNPPAFFRPIGKIFAFIIIGFSVFAMLAGVVSIIVFAIMVWLFYEKVKRYLSNPHFYSAVTLIVLSVCTSIAAIFPLANVENVPITLLSFLLCILVPLLQCSIYENMKPALPLFFTLISVGLALCLRYGYASGSDSTDNISSSSDTAYAGNSDTSVLYSSTPVFDNSSTVTGNVDVASANGVNFDNSTELNTVPDNMGPTQVTVTDMTGGTQETITQVSDNRYEIKDSMGITHGNVYVNDGTGETMINVDGQTLVESSNGEIRNPFDPNADVAHAQPDGSVIVQDNMSQYAGGVLSDGTIVDSQMNPVGKVHKH